MTGSALRRRSADWTRLTERANLTFLHAPLGSIAQQAATSLASFDILVAVRER